MTALVLAMLMQGAVPDLPTPQGPPTEPVAEQIVQIERTMKRFEGGVYKKDGKLTCRIEASSGDKDVDMVRCGAMLRCLAPEAEELDAIAASDLPAADRSRQLQAIVAGAQPCVENAKAAGVRMLAEKRAGTQVTR